MEEQENFPMEDDAPELDRMAHAILIVLYEKHPMAMSKEEILTIISKRGLLEMTDKQFEEYKKNILQSKMN